MDVTDTVPFIALSLSSRFSVAWPALVFTISEVPVNKVLALLSLKKKKVL